MTGLAQIAIGTSLAASSPAAAQHSDHETVAMLDLAYQAAVKANDAETIDKILHPQFELVRGNGQVVSREAIIDAAREKSVVYEVQDEEPGTQHVRVWGATAVVTALLNIAGTENGRKFSTKLWFSDTYVRTASGWRYAFAQVSLPLPQD